MGIDRFPSGLGTVLVLLAGTNGLACSSSAGPEENPSVGRTTQALEADTETGVEYGDPIDVVLEDEDTPAPPKSIVAPPFQKSSVDHVEMYEGTYRTIGSRRMLLEVIRHSSGELRKRRIGIYRDAVRGLSSQERRDALEELWNQEPDTYEEEN